MSKQKYLKSIVINQDFAPDKKVHECIERMPGYSPCIKAMILDFFKKNKNPELKLQLMWKQYKVDCGGMSESHLKLLNREIKEIKKELGEK